MPVPQGDIDSICGMVTGTPFDFYPADSANSATT